MARAAVLMALAAAACCGANLFPVAGVVTNAITHSPIPHAIVLFYRSGTPAPGNPLITGTDGHFRFDVPAGTYVLHAGIRGTTQNYGTREDQSPLGSAVIVGPGKDTGNIVFPFYPTSSISGKILDTDGEPVENATVQLIRVSVSQGRRVAAVFRSVRSNDRGEYRLGWIPGGNAYYIAVTGKPWHSAIMPMADHEAYAPVFYPNTSEPTQAAPLKVAPGEEARADFALRTLSGAQIDVKHDAPAGSKGQISLISSGVAGVDAVQQQIALVTGQGNAVQTLVGVPPGSYTLRVTASDPSGDFIGLKRVDVNGANVSVGIALHPAASVSGRLVTADRPRTTPVIVFSRVDGASTYSASVKPDGTFRVSGVMPAKYLINIQSTDGYYAAKIESSSFHNGVLDVGDGDAASVEISAGADAGVVKGIVTSGGKPVAGALAVLAPAEGASQGSRYRAFQTESDGSFEILNVPPGKYLFFAIEDTLLEYTNPEAVRPWLPAAVPLRVDPRGTVSQDIVLTVSKP